MHESKRINDRLDIYLFERFFSGGFKDLSFTTNFLCNNFQLVKLISSTSTKLRVENTRG